MARTQQFDRYIRQAQLGELGEEGQARLARSQALIVGCGGLGGTAAQLLVRAGLGHVRMVDHDHAELHNLHRQLLFDEEDVATARAKAEIAEEKLRKVNSEVRIEGMRATMKVDNARALIAGMDVVLDATDNPEARYLINDTCLALGVPWVYGGAVGVTGMLMSFRPSAGPCFRCVFPDPPAPGTLPTCESHGVLGTLPTLVASLQATEALKLLLGCDESSGRLLVVDAWQGLLRHVRIEQSGICQACGSQSTTRKAVHDSDRVSQDPKW